MMIQKAQNNFSPFGADLFGEPIQEVTGPLNQRYVVSPFAVLNAREGDWQKRKSAWIGMGIESEGGRKEELVYSKKLWEKYNPGTADSASAKGTSIFDPVLCELIYNWFTRPGARILDPFAGGSVRGIVAGCLERKYYGIDLRAEQVSANNAQQNKVADVRVAPQWVTGDALDAAEEAPECDFVFSCPPYGDLEQYSEDPRDLSNMEYHTFLAAYKRIILKSVKKLKPNRFACFVVGDFRDKKGFYRNFVSETINGFEAAGALLYNEAVLVTSTGTAGLRATRQFEAGRKLVKTHQNVLVFCKGDWRKATKEATGA